MRWNASELLDRELVCIGGRTDLPGRPLLYETTDLFFEHFGIKTVSDLPNASELRTIKLPEPEEKKPETTESNESDSENSEPQNEFENLNEVAEVNDTQATDNE